MKKKEENNNKSIADIMKSFDMISLSQYMDEIGEIKKYSTGIKSFDIILGGGIPAKRMIEIYGEESTGKTTIALKFLEAIQNIGGYTLFIDTEFALDPNRILKFNRLDPNKLIIYEENIIENIFDYIKKFVVNIRTIIKEDIPVAILLDSLAALIAKSEVDDEVKAKEYEERANLITKCLRRLMPLLSRYNIIFIVTNHEKAKIGGNPFLKEHTTPGGKAVKYHSTIRLRTRRKQYIKEKEKEIGILSNIMAVKNKIAPPKRNCCIPIYFDNRGITNELAVLFHLSGLKAIKIDRSNIILGENKIKKSEWKTFVNDNPDIIDSLYNEIYKISEEINEIEDDEEGEDIDE